MNKNTFNFSALKATNKKVEALAVAVANAEAEVVLAEQALVVAKRDDGTVDPGQLIQRIDGADHSFRVRQIEANRAAAKLEEVEAEFHSMLRDAAEPVILDLTTRVEAEKEKIRNRLEDVIGKDVCAARSHEVNAMVGASESVARIAMHIQLVIRARMNVGQGFSNGADNLIDPVLGAEQLLRES